MLHKIAHAWANNWRQSWRSTLAWNALVAIWAFVIATHTSLLVAFIALAVITAAQLLAEEQGRINCERRH